MTNLSIAAFELVEFWGVMGRTRQVCQIVALFSPLDEIGTLFWLLWLLWASAEVQDADHFLWFLKTLKFLSRLELAKTGLSQEFYDQLPASAHLLSSLHLRDGHCENELHLNFDFIGKLSGLSHLEIGPPLSVESLPLLARWFGRLVEGRFVVLLREEYLTISKGTNSSEWEIDRSGNLQFKTNNPDQIVDFFESLRDDRSRV